MYSFNDITHIICRFGICQPVRFLSDCYKLVDFFVIKGDNHVHNN